MTQTIDEGRAQLIASAQAVVAIHAEWSTPLPTHIESTLFTIAQEALLNVRRHAIATTVIVTLQVRHEQAMLVVQDNGIGLSPRVLQFYSSNTMHLGLKGMQHRIEELASLSKISNALISNALSAP